MSGKRVKNVRMLGTSQQITFRQTSANLTITMPDVENTGKLLKKAVLSSFLFREICTFADESIKSSRLRADSPTEHSGFATVVSTMRKL